MSRFTDPMLLAREPGAGDGQPPATEGDFWRRMEASGVNVTRADSTDTAEGIQSRQTGLEKG